MSDGMDTLGQAISNGRLLFSESLDMLMSAHIRMFGTPNTRGAIFRLEERLTERLLKATDRHSDPTIYREKSQENELER